MNDRTRAAPSLFSWTFSFLAGGVTGAGVALLLAPRSGRATREMMRPADACVEARAWRTTSVSGLRSTC
jgi:gas vesicle protein